MPPILSYFLDGWSKSSYVGIAKKLDYGTDFKDVKSGLNEEALLR